MIIDGKRYYSKEEVDSLIDNVFHSTTTVHADLYTRLDKVVEILYSMGQDVSAFNVKIEEGKVVG